MAEGKEVAENKWLPEDVNIQMQQCILLEKFGRDLCMCERRTARRLMVRQERDKKVLLVQQEEKVQKLVSMEYTEQAEEWKEVGWCFGRVGPKGGVLLICHREWFTVLPTTCCSREQE